MAPTRSKKRKSTESTSSTDIQSFPAPPRMIPTKTDGNEMTPTSKSPVKRSKMGITVGQKQALIDNLQLEVTERARKLRAQYMLQAQGLRARIEIRVNRIPMALRKEKMGDLVTKYHQAAPKLVAAGTSRGAVKPPAKYPVQEAQRCVNTSPSPQHSRKRMSDEMATDKENEDLPNPKKRPRGAPVPPERTTSRARLEASNVLSPRSANSRTLPRSPVRTQMSPGKSQLARPVSPLKPIGPIPSGGAAGILTGMGNARGIARKAIDPSTGVGRGKRIATTTAPAAQAGKGRASTISDSSDASSTTIVRKPGTKTATSAPIKKGVINTIKGLGSQKKMPAATKSAAPVVSGRVLRKRY